MYINYGNNLFMPEGDDYSKTEFDKATEEISSEGNAILQKLRMQQAAEYASRLKDTQKKVKKAAKILEKEEKKMTYKEIFDEMVASK